MSNLEKLGNKDSIKKFGSSPFAKKQLQSVSQITTKISRSKHNELKLLAFKKHTTMFKLLDEIIEDGINKIKQEDDVK